MKKKRWLLALLLVLACMLSACNFNSNIQDNTGKAEMQSEEKVQQMMTALANKDKDGALALMHKEVAEKSESALRQLADFLVGRQVSKLERVNLQVKNSVGTGGSIRQEQAAFRAELTDGTTVYLSVTHVSGMGEEGFYSFQIVLGAF